MDYYKNSFLGIELKNDSCVELNVKKTERDILNATLF